MHTPDPHWAPKVHPLDRGLEPEDPFELMAEPVGGDPQVMLECLLQEFIWMGWDAQSLELLFHSPDYPVLGALARHFGADELRRRIAEWTARTGVLRFREQIAECAADDDDEEHGPELVQIQLPAHAAVAPPPTIG
jgi:hypothetical protein